MASVPELNGHEARVFGVLVEKSMTTPDQYPLSLNATVSGSNQKSNRDPVVDFTEAEVTVALQGLTVKGYAGRTQPAGSRVEKFHHNGLALLGVEKDELAILAELLMRGPQTQGELRQRASRMQTIPDLGTLQRLLDGLAQRDLVERVAPAPGSRAERWGQRLAPDLHPVGDAPPAAAATSTVAPSAVAPAAPGPSASGPGASGLGARVEALEAEVRSLREDLDELRSQLGVS